MELIALEIAQFDPPTLKPHHRTKHEVDRPPVPEMLSFEDSKMAEGHVTPNEDGICFSLFLYFLFLTLFIR